MGKKRYIPDLVAQGFMLLGAMMGLAPIAWMVSTSLKPEKYVMSAIPRWLPNPATMSNFTELFTQAEDFPVIRWLFNSLFVSTSVTFLVLFVASTAAYAFARLSSRGGTRYSWWWSRP